MNTDVENYFAALPEKRREKLKLLHEAILACFPDAKVDMHYKMPTYSYSEGWVAIANQKSYVSLYTCGAHHIEAFKLAYPEYKAGQGCINFRMKDDIPLEAIQQVVRHAIEHPKG
jgi:Domain of unknown function (DU1801).